MLSFFAYYELLRNNCICSYIGYKLTCVNKKVSQESFICASCCVSVRGSGSGSALLYFGCHLIALESSLDVVKGPCLSARWTLTSPPPASRTHTALRQQGLGELTRRRAHNVGSVSQTARLLSLLSGLDFLLH